MDWLGRIRKEEMKRRDISITKTYLKESMYDM